MLIEWGKLQSEDEKARDALLKVVHRADIDNYSKRLALSTLRKLGLSAAKLADELVARFISVGDSNKVTEEVIHKSFDNAKD